MDRRLLAFRLAGGGWLLSAALALAVGSSNSGFGYGTVMLSVLVALQLIPAVMIGLGGSALAARLAIVIGPLVATLAFAMATATGLSSLGANDLYLPVVLLPLAATALSLVAGYWFEGEVSATTR